MMLLEQKTIEKVIFENLKVEKKNKKDSCYLKNFLCLWNFKKYSYLDRSIKLYFN